jgi:hypothetical protein
MAKKTKEEKQQAKALKIQQREAKQQEKFTYAAADGKISGSEIRDLFGQRGFKFGGKTFGGMSREEQATALAKFALGNPNVAIGKGASKMTGLKIKTDDTGARFATYKPETISSPPNMWFNSSGGKTTVTPDFGKANTSWSAVGGGKFIYGGAPGTRVSFAGDTAGLTEPLSGAGSSGIEYLDTGTGDTGTGGGGSSVTDPTVTAQLPSISTGVGTMAAGFRTKKSSRKMAKGSAQGYGSMKIGTGTPFASTVNLG